MLGNLLIFGYPGDNKILLGMYFPKSFLAHILIVSQFNIYLFNYKSYSLTYHP